MNSWFALFRRPFGGWPPLRGLSALGLLVLVLGLGVPAAAQNDCDCPEIHITQPANGATGLGGIIRIDAVRYPYWEDSGNWEGDPWVEIYNAQNTLVEAGYMTDDGTAGSPYPLGARKYFYEWDGRLLPSMASYTIKVVSDHHDWWGDWCGSFCYSDPITVSIKNAPYMRHVTTAKMPPHIVSDYLPTHGGSTHPLLGFQAFAVPITSWQHHGKTYAMALHYDSSSFMDPQSLPPVDFPGLSDKASHWTHSFAMWLDLYQDELWFAHYRSFCTV